MKISFFDRLSGKNTDLFNSASVKKHLNNKDSFNILLYPSLVSTQDTAREAAADGAPEGTVIIADSQSGGRGRQGRRFFSPENSGIYLSLILRPSVSAPLLSPKSLIFITVSAAVAVSDAIRKICGKRTDIKWVNDIFLSGKKICGILAEGAFTPDGSGYEHIILGIGINLYDSLLPEDIRNIAGSIYGKKPKNAEKIKARLTAEVINRFFKYYSDISAGDFSFTEVYKERSLVIGKNVDIIIGENVTDSGRVLSLNDDCSLNVLSKSGEHLTLSYGEVRIKLNEK